MTPFPMMRRYCRYTLALLALLLTSTSRAESECGANARTELETAYCKIQQAGLGEGLPAFADFRRNPPQTQALLLKRPAARLGLTLPTSSAATSKPSPSVASETPPASPVISGSQKERRSQRHHESNNSPRSEEDAMSPPSGGLTARCVLQGELIRCGDSRYQLLTNQPNASLAKDALTQDNRLQMPAAENFEGSLHDYLAHCYERYIEKMVSIGLAGSTMSYSKFYYTFQEMDAQNSDFAGRFATMFTYLQKDKASMGIQQRYSTDLPSSLKQCAQLNARWIVCDEANHNWIYQRR